MKVELKLYAFIERHVRETIGSPAPRFVEVKSGTTIKEVLERFEVPLDIVKLIFLNGVHAELDAILNNGDRLGVFPPIAGG